jgi:hypothetical protein
MEEQFIECPQCGTKIELSEALSKKIRDDIEKDLKERFQKDQDKAKRKVEEDLRAVFETEMADLRDELDQKKVALNKANEEELKLRKKMREVDDRERDLELEIERKLCQEREKLDSELKVKGLEKDKIINDLKEQIGDLKRKAEQGSMQLQGEALEIDFEGFLKNRYPADEISEVPKGVEGADIIQKVMRHDEECGVILWEIKNTKNFSDKWIDKLKEDQAKLKASVAVIVTKALPSGVNILCNMKGIWVLSYKFATEFVEIIRQNILAISNVQIAQVGKEEKMEAVYDYLSGDLFRQRVEAIVHAFTDMKGELEREKRAMQKNWSAREMSIGRIITNTVRMYGDIQGIVGASLPRISSLELEGESLESSNN